MSIDFFPFLTFVFITTFTPGPNNITSASMGILFGYKKTLHYLLGIVSGFCFVVFICGLISSTLLNLIPSFEMILRIIGAVYILWLAYHTMKASYSFSESEQRLFGFAKGFFLQLLNPKVIVYGLTLYSTFLSDLAGKPVAILLSAVFLSAVGFSSISTWTVFGASIRKYLNHRRVKRIFNTVLSLMLVYTAIEISGILSLFS